MERPAEDVLVLALVLDTLQLRDAVLAYSCPGGVLLPLGQLAAALDFAITVDPASGQADGWLLAEDRRFHLDVARRSVLIGGEPGPFEPSRIELHVDDIYVHSQLLSRWWPVDLELDLAQMEVRVRGRETLPVEARIERQSRRRDLLARRAGRGPHFERQRLAYLPWSWPLIDGRVQASANRSGGGTRFEARQDALLVGEVAGLSAELFVSDVESPATDRTQGRLRFGRQDPEGGLLGLPGVRELFVGDLLTPDRPLVSRSRSSRGVEVSTFPLDRLAEPHLTHVRGEALPGWEVELYRNDDLLDFQHASEDGRYAFENVPLVQGFNLLRLAFYGPQGERREEVRRLYVQPGPQASPGLRYRLALYEQGRYLFAQQERSRAVDPTRGDPRLFLEVETSVGQRHTLLAALQSLTLEDGRHNYLSLEGSSRFGPLFGLLDLAADTRGGWAARTVLQSRLGGVDLLLDDSRFFDFANEELDERRDALESRSSFRAQGKLAHQRLGFTLEGRWERNRSGARATHWAARLSAHPDRFATTFNVDWEERCSAAGIRTSRTLAGLLASGTWHRLSLRGQADYRLAPRSAPTHISLTADWALGSQSSLSFELARNFDAASSTRYGLGLARRFPQLSFGSGLSYEDHGSLSADVSLSFSLGRDPYSGRWRTSWRPLARRGVAVVRVFLDRDGNGRMDTAEEPLPGVRITRDGHPTGVVTDENGLGFLTRLVPHRHVDVGLAVGSLEDPFWLPAKPGVGLLPRPGRIAAVDLPVVAGGEIDGVVVFRRDGVEVELAEVRLELLDEEGGVTRSTETAFDGFYLFDAVRPGHYRVRVAPEQLARRKLVSTPPPEVTIRAGGSVTRGVDFVLTRPSEARPRSADGV